MIEETVAERNITIGQEPDIIFACQQSRQLSRLYGFSTKDQSAIVTVILEVGHNILKYAQTGEIHLHIVRQQERHGLVITAHDQGPGIPDIDQALQDGYSTGQTLGLGLPGARRLMDEFELISTIGHGTTVVMKKWTTTT